MAVIQISKMQVRRGQTAQTGFPQLSSGELGWSIDTQQLYIGNGSVAEGAPAVGNTQIITENNVTNFFKFAKTSYTYKETFDPNSGSSQGGIGVARTLQDKLDDFVTLSDFIPSNSSTVSDYSAIFNTAISYASKTAGGKPLYVPEGTYIVSDTIKLYPQTELRGAGLGKTIINSTGTNSVFQTIAADGTTFDQDGGQSLSSGVNRPKNIRINGFTIINTNTGAKALVSLDCVEDGIVEQCEFRGQDSNNASTATTASVVGIYLRDVAGFPGNTIDNLMINKNKFVGLSDAVFSDYDTGNINIIENKFDNLNRGIVFDTTYAVAGGAKHVTISNNSFENINRQAIISKSTSTVNDINSINNFFYNVGCNNQGDTTGTQVTEIIAFGGFGNYSSGDTFDRLDRIQASNYVTGPSSVQPLVSGPVFLRTKGPQQTVLSGQGTNNPWFSLPRSQFQYQGNTFNQLVTVEYTVNWPYKSLVKRGTLEITVTGTSAYVRDSSTSTNDAEGDNISFSARVDATKNLVTVYYNNSTNTPSGQLRPNIIYTYTVRQ